MDYVSKLALLVPLVVILLVFVLAARMAFIAFSALATFAFSARLFFERARFVGTAAIFVVIMLLSAFLTMMLLVAALADGFLLALFRI